MISIVEISVVASLLLIASVVVAKKLIPFKPSDQPKNIPNSSPPPKLYNGIFEPTSLGGSRKNRQRKNKSRRR